MPLLRPVRTWASRSPTSNAHLDLANEAIRTRSWQSGTPTRLYTRHLTLQRIELYNGTPLQAFAAFMAFMAFIAATVSTIVAVFFALAAFIAFMAFMAAAGSTTALDFLALAAFIAFMAFVRAACFP